AGGLAAKCGRDRHDSADAAGSERRGAEGARAGLPAAQAADQPPGGTAARLASARSLSASPNDTRTIAPPPGAFAASTPPPWASAAWRTIARPSPEPGSERAL